MKSPRQWFKKRPALTTNDASDNLGAVANVSDNLDQGERQQSNLPPELLWLLDAPLFIDAKRVDAFYDAVLRPDYEGTSITLSNSITTKTTFGGKTTVGVALPWFGKAEVAASAERSRSRDHGLDTTLRPISNAYRHLLSIALHYASQQDYNRLVIADASGSRASNSVGESILGMWTSAEFADIVPRALVFLDLPPGTKIIPTALELIYGKVQVVIDALGKRLAGSAAPEYPGSTATQLEKDSYFQWFTEHYIDRTALEVVESTVQEGKISWIDFNASLAGGGPPFMHLHLAGRGEYDTGVFGYYFIVRGFTHGLRIVGTLKSGPDLNVLAVFER